LAHATLGTTRIRHSWNTSQPILGQPISEPANFGASPAVFRTESTPRKREYLPRCRAEESGSITQGGGGFNPF